MEILDVNILVYAFRDEMTQHTPMAAYLNALVNDDRAFGVPEVVLSALVRIVTQKPWNPPSPPAKVLDFCSALRSAPNCLVVQPRDSHWGVFDYLCRATGARGKRVADAYLAAYALDRGDEWVTTDADFHRFPGLRWRNLLTGQSGTNPR